jgi:predicted AlkP superfamily phosphohydrolase/phosphomutase
MEKTGLSEKIFIFGIDGASPELIDSLIEKGRLPTFRLMKQQGVSGKLRTTVPPITGSAWSSFMTGKNPGKHGIFDFIYRKEGTYSLAPISGKMRNGKSFWSLAGEEGKKICILNVPVTYPPEPVNGVMISGMLTPANKDDFVYPSSLKKEIDKVVSNYRIHITESFSKNGEEKFLSHLYSVTSDREKLMDYLLDLEDWDLFVVVFQGVDIIQHELFHTLEKNHFRYKESGSEYGDAIPRFYERMDGLLAKIMERWKGPDRTIVVMSDHGAGPLKKLLYVNNFLMTHGFLKLKNNLITQVKYLLFKCGLSPMTFYHVLLRVGLGKLKHKARFAQGSSWLKKFFLSYEDVDWSKTKAYAIGTTAGQIYMNLKGREPEGCVMPGDDYRKVREEVIGALYNLTDTESGDKVVEELYRKEDLYIGPNADKAPDIVFLPKGLETAAFGEYEFASHRLIDYSRGLSGAHRMDGLFMMSGMNVKRGEIVRNAHIMDLAPTVLYLMGLPVPKDMDGKVLDDALDDGLLQTYPVATSEEISGASAGSEGYSEKEEEQLKGYLKSLGYFE